MSTNSRLRRFYEGYRPTTFEQFQGLDLKSAPDQSACIDMLNVDITLDGNLRTRDGSSIFSTSDTNASSAPGSLFAFNSLSSPQLIVVARDTTAGDLRYYAISSVGVVGAGFDSAGGLGQCSAAQIGTASGSFMYITNGSSAGLYPVRYDGATFTQPTVTVDGVGGKQGPFSKLLVTSPIDNRLVTAGTLNGASGPNAVTSSTSHVWFSDPGLPESYSSTNFVQLVPGDGEQITAAVSWRELVFIFKQTKFFVFYGTSTDSTGKPIFNYRTVAGVGAEPASNSIGPPYAVAGSDGVYFANSAGIFKTTGQAPVKISMPLDPIWQGGASAFWQGGTVTGLGVNALTWFNERLYVTMTTSVATLGNLVLVYDPRQGVDRWLVWQVGTAQVIYPVAFAPTVGGPKGLYFCHGKRVRVFSSAATDDAGTAITSRYRSGFGFGGPDETVVRETILDGSGTPTLQWSRDWGSLVTGSAVTLGTAPAISVGRQRIAIRGRRFSWQLGATGPVNLITTAPGFEGPNGSTLGWDTAASFRNATGAILTTVQSPVHPGLSQWAGKVVTTAVATQGIDWINLVVSNGVQITAAFWLAGAVGGETVFLVIGDATVGFTQGSTQVLTTSFQRFSVTLTPGASGTTGVSVVQSGASVRTFYVDDCIVAAGATAPAFDAADWSLQRLQAQQRDLRESSITV